MSNEKSKQAFMDTEKLKELSKILSDVNQKSQSLVRRFIENRERDPVDQKELEGIGKSFQDLAGKLLADPSGLLNAQMNYWQDYWKLVQQSALQLLGTPADPVIAPEKGDKRFHHEDWEANPLFNFIKQSYLLTARAIRDTVQNVDGLDEKIQRKIEFYTNQYLNAISPSNFIATNPELLKLTLDSRGENLIKGLKHLLEDLDRGPCGIQIQMTDLDAFEVGKNLAVTPGKVVFQNDLIQLIQYQPSTPKVFQRPLLIVPPWINKYYILDLTEKNSFVKWLVDQGYTVFMISWANPDAHLMQKDFEHYMLDGPLAAMEAVEKATGQHTINAIGYCMGGTLLACTAAYLAARGEDDRLASLTFMASLMDFSDPGDIGVFIDEEKIDVLEQKMNQQGYLDGCAMSNSFSMLRSNDLVWSYVINNYLKGATPIPFDILYWNSDATNLPATMHSFYLRNMYLHNRLREPGGITLNGTPIDLGKIRQPVYFISTREDHISLWRSTYAGAHLVSGPVRFVLGASGHVAGIVNPPSRNKYGHWTNTELPENSEEWLKKAEFNDFSWWKDWLGWNKSHAGKRVPPPTLSKKAIEDAPGCYVTNRLDRPESGVCYLSSALM